MASTSMLRRCQLSWMRLGLGEVNLLGHSMGGQVAISLAAHSPFRISKLVLVDSAGLPRFEPSWQLKVRMLGDSGLWNLRMLPSRIRWITQATAGRECMRMIEHEFVMPYLRQLTMPTLIVWGSRDRVVPLEHGAVLARHIPHAKLVVIRAAGHLPFYQKAQEFNRIVLSFLKQ